ncbi:hypothetical protein Tco_0800609 [Tanacetum coccineum]|uniref:Uncharacterized protein n=1 Tax=Tanacetum coccineum TaxID=301880 RepID=A0ABQ4ZW06_9ASTR
MEMQDGLGYDWSYIAQDEPTEFALMAYTSNSSGSDTEVQKGLDDSVYWPKANKTSTSVSQVEIGLVELSLKIGYNHLIKDCDFHEKRMAKKSILKNIGKNYGQRKIRPVWNSAQRINHQNKFVPSEVLTRFGRVLVSAAKQSSLRATTSTSTFRPVNTATHTNRVNVSKLKTNVFHKSHSPIRRSFYKSTTQNTRISNEKVNTVRVNGINTVGQTTVSTVKGTGVTTVKASGNPQQALKNKGIFDSRCSRHMTGNKDFLTDYQDIDGGFVAFGGSARGGKITGKEKIRTDKKVEENLHVNFLKNKPNVARQGPNWLFDIDSLTNSMNYQPVTAGNQTNKNAGPQEANGDTADDVAGETPVQKPASEYEQALKNVLDKMMDQEKEASEQSDVVRKEFEAQCNRELLQGKATKASSTNSFNNVSTTVNAASAPRTSNDAGPSFVSLSRSFPLNVNDLLDDPLDSN